MGSATTLTLSSTLTPYKPTAISTRRTSTNTSLSQLFLAPIQLSNHGACSLECKKGLKFAVSSSNTNWVQIVSPKDYEDDEFVVVNFYRFVYIEDPEVEVSKHLSFLQVLLIKFHLCFLELLTMFITIWSIYLWEVIFRANVQLLMHIVRNCINIQCWKYHIPLFIYYIHALFFLQVDAMST